MNTRIQLGGHGKGDGGGGKDDEQSDFEKDDMTHRILMTINNNADLGQSDVHAHRVEF